MSKSINRKMGVPLSISLEPTLDAENMHPKIPQNKKRLISVSCMAVIVAIAVSLVAKGLMFIINFITNVSFFGSASINSSNPSENHMGLWVIIIPVIGGIIVGLMTKYGSEAIKGHGIPEAMEQILTNKSKIRPTIVYLKPLSSAIAIGTGGPFGAEGPIIATGGALGSALGQILKISHNERKILLASGAAAGMAAVFGSPIASIFLAIELLLFEFSPRSIIPVALSCITGAAGHHLLFGQGPVFPMQELIKMPSNTALFWYSLIGIFMGFLSILTTKAVYFVEDLFNKIPIHWIWYPALGGLSAGIIGYFAPRTLGVGYYNITDILTGQLTIHLILSLSVLKFISWAVALGSGTSGGTLAPLLTIGGATGILFGTFILLYFPNSGITLPLAALIGMSSLFAGASRALLTSIIFAIESTGQSNALLPLLAACAASYFISFFFMKNTIMTEKIARKGVKVPESYESDVMEKVLISEVAQKNLPTLDEEVLIDEAIRILKNASDDNPFIIVTDEHKKYKGFLEIKDIWNTPDTNGTLRELLSNKVDDTILDNNNLWSAIKLMLKTNKEILPVISHDNNQFIGILTYKDILLAYKMSLDENEKSYPNISIKRRGLKTILRGQHLFEHLKNRSNQHSK